MKKARLLTLMITLLLSTFLTPLGQAAELTGEPVADMPVVEDDILENTENPIDSSEHPVDTTENPEILPESQTPQMEASTSTEQKNTVESLIQDTPDEQSDEKTTAQEETATLPVQHINYLEGTDHVISNLPSKNWTAYFYNNTKLSGKYTYKKTILAGEKDLSVYQNYSTGSPHNSIYKDGFSAKIQGTFSINPGTYVLRLQHEDGAKILIDGKVIVDNWKKGNTREDAIKFTIENKNNTPEGNQHLIQIRYVDYTGASFFKFTIEPYEEAQKTSNWIGEIYNTSNHSGTAYIVGGDNARTKINALNFNWTNKTPTHLVAGPKYSSRWYSYQYFKAGTYTLSAKANDSITVYFNNEKIINQNSTNGSTLKGTFTVLQDGYYFIRVDHAKKDGKKNGKLELQLPFIHLTTNEIAYNWGSGSPATSVPNDNFLATIVSNQKISAGDHFITSVSLGSVSVSFGEQDNIIHTTGTGTQMKTAAVLDQTAGTYPLTAAYHAGTGNAGIFTQIVPFNKWSAFIYPSASVYGLPKAQTIVSESTSYKLNYYLGSKAPATGVSANNYAVRFINYKHLTAGSYTVKAASKAGAFSVYIDGKKVLSSGSIQTSSASDSATVTIADDTHAAKGDIHEIMIIFQKRTGTTDFIFDIAPVQSEDDSLVTENNYQTLDLRKPAPSSFTTTVMDNYLKSDSRYASSPFIGKTQIFLDAQDKYGVNALFLFSLAVHEGMAATSDIGSAKNNSFGLGAYDNCPFDCAQYFPTLEDSINYQAYMLKRNYLTTGGLYANGPYLGDKNGGLNVRYATDPLWGQKTANIMQKILPYDSFHYNFTSPIVENGTNPGNDFVYKYPSGIKGVVTTSSLNVRKTPDTNYTAIATLSKKEIVEVTGRHNYNYFQIQYGGATRYVSQNPNSPYMKLLNLGRVAPSSGVASVKLWKNLDPNSSEYHESIKRTTYVELVLDSKNKPIVESNTLGSWYKVRSAKGNVGWMKKTDVVQVFAASSSDLP